MSASASAPTTTRFGSSSRGTAQSRGELLALDLKSIQQREEHWVVADLIGKGGQVRTVPIPTWVKATMDAWTSVAGIRDGAVFSARLAHHARGGRHVDIFHHAS